MNVKRKSPSSLWRRLFRMEWLVARELKVLEVVIAICICSSIPLSMIFAWAYVSMRLAQIGGGA